MRLPAARDVHFDIDAYLNHIVPRSRIARLPKPVSRFLGHRDRPAPPIGNVLVASWALVGAFAGLAAVSATYRFSPDIRKYHPPVIIASLGATAILNYNVIQSPLAQPRNAVAGNAIAAIVGVAITKLFMLSPDFESLRWIAGPLCCAVASWIMAMTNCVYPPGGATAILAATDATVGALGWMYIPVILLGTLIMLGVALVTNNIQRQYPVFWWTPQNVGPQSKPDVEEASQDNEKDLKRELGVREHADLQHRIVITEDHISIPHAFGLGAVEMQVIAALRDRLRNADRSSHFSQAPSEHDSDQTAHSSRDVLPSLKSQKSNEPM